MRSRYAGPCCRCGERAEAIQNAIYGFEYIEREILHGGDAGARRAVEKAREKAAYLRSALSLARGEARHD